MKEEILKILEKYKQETTRAFSYNIDIVIYEDKFEDIADDILELLKSLEINK